MKIIKIKDTSWKKADDEKWEALVKKVYNDPKYYDKFIEYINKNDEQLVDFYELDLEDFVNNVVYKDGKLNEKYKDLPKNQKEFDNLSNENKAKFIRSLDKKILNEWKNKHYKDEWDKFYAFDKFFEELYDKEYHIKDSVSLTFEEWKNSEDYENEVNEAIDNFLNDDGDEIIKQWNEYCEKEGGDNASKYMYESIYEVKEDIETGANDIDNIIAGNKKLGKDLRLELESVYEKYHGMIKDDNEEELTFEKWQENDKYQNERDEVVNNFLNQYGNELIKFWNKEVEETYRYYTVDRLKEDIRDGWNDIFNVTIGNDDLLKKLDLEFKKIYEKYHGPIKENENDKVDHSIFYTTGVDRNYFGRKFRHLNKDKILEKNASEIDFDYLLSEERKAVQDYKDSIAKTSDKSALYVLNHILKEENHHIELLENLRDGKVEFEDSKDDDFDWGVKLVELSMDNIRDYDPIGTKYNVKNIIDYNFFHQNYELLKSEVQKQMEHPEDMTEFEDEFYEFTDYDDLLDFIQDNYVLRRKYQDYIEQMNKKYGKFVREDQVEKTAEKIIDKIKKDIKFRV